MRCEGELYARLWRPFLLAALNTEPAEAPAGLAAVVIRETLLKGGRASRPLIAREGLSGALIDPALHYLESRGVTVRFEHNLRGIEFGRRRVAALDFGGEPVRLNYDDAVVLAVPAVMAKTLVPSRRLDRLKCKVNEKGAIALALPALLPPPFPLTPDAPPTSTCRSTAGRSSRPLARARAPSGPRRASGRSRRGTRPSCGGPDRRRTRSRC